MRKHKGSISKAKSYKQIGEFWDTHDLTEFWGQTQKRRVNIIQLVYYTGFIAVQVKRIVLRIGLISLGFLIDVNAFQNQVHHGDTAATEGYF